MSADNPARVLAGAIERLASRGQYRPDEWLRFLSLDVLAGFGKRLERPWDDWRHARLFDLAKLYGKLVAAHPWQDVLGGAYMELGSRGQHAWLAQYFTPQPIADCMARMALHDLDPDTFPSDRLVTVLEPASGAGIMLLAACGAVAEERGPQALRRLSLTAVDLDEMCALMTACQLLSNGVLHGAFGELLVFRGNALGPPGELEVVVHMSATPRFARAEPIPEILPAKAPARIAAIRQACIGEQLSLFDDDPLPVAQRTRA